MGAGQGLREPDRLFYDGGCALCHWTVRFLALHDRVGMIRYAPLGGATFQGTLAPDIRESLPDSVVVKTSEGRILVRAEALIHLLRRLGGGWAVLGWFVDAMPEDLVDRLYEVVARHRRAWFRRPAGPCPVLPAGFQARFDP